MPQTLADVYYSIQSRRCREHNCSVQLNHLVSYCAKSMRDRVFPGDGAQTPVCDCIVTDSAEARISLVELKDSTSTTTKINYRLVNEVRGQFCGGLAVLRKVLKQAEKREISLQLVLFTKLSLNRSEKLRLRRPLPGVPDTMTIVDRPCGCILPTEHQRLKIWE